MTVLERYEHLKELVTERSVEFQHLMEFIEK